MNLSSHFTLEELTFSEYAARNGLDNTPPAPVLENLKYLAERLEAVRALLGVPLQITSGYRAPAVNAGIGGARDSQHCLGLAADFVAPQFGEPYWVARRIETAAVQYDQLIHEFGRWAHVSFVRYNPRRQSLTTFKAGVYLPGITRS
jgi:hypothetical protein